MKFEYITKVPYSLSIACCKIRHACNLKWHITLADNTQYLWAELWYKRVLIGQRSSREAVCKSTWQRKTLYHRTPLVMGSAHVNWKWGSVWAVLAMQHKRMRWHTTGLSSSWLSYCTVFRRHSLNPLGRTLVITASRCLKGRRYKDDVMLKIRKIFI